MATCKQRSARTFNGRDTGLDPADHRGQRRRAKAARRGGLQPNRTRPCRSDGDRGRRVPQRTAHAACRIAAAVGRIARPADRDRRKRTGTARGSGKEAGDACRRSGADRRRDRRSRPRRDGTRKSLPRRNGPRPRKGSRIAIDAARAETDEATRAAADRIASDATSATGAFGRAARRRPLPPRERSRSTKPVAASVPAINRPTLAESTAAKPAILSERAERKVAAVFRRAFGSVCRAQQEDLRRNGRGNAAADAAGLAGQQSAGPGRAAGARGNRARGARRRNRHSRNAHGTRRLRAAFFVCGRQAGLPAVDLPAAFRFTPNRQKSGQRGPISHA